MRYAIPLLALAAAAPAQGNILQNSDFGDSLTTVAPWEFINRQWMTNVAWGKGHLTWDNYSSAPRSPVGFKQRVLLVESGTYLAQMFATSYAWTGVGYCRASIQGESVTFGFQGTQHQARPIQLKAGLWDIEFTIGQSNDPTDRWDVHAVALRKVERPVAYWATNASAEPTLVLHAHADAGSFVIGMLAFQRLEPAIALPGIAGELHLDPWRSGGIMFLPPVLVSREEWVSAGWWMARHFWYHKIPTATIYGQVLEISTRGLALSNRDALLKFRR
jgi:hypothetical protein